MNVAVLMQIHKNPEQVKKTINYMSHPNIDFFIHLDKKSKITPEQVEEIKELNDGRVYFLPKRHSVYLFNKTIVLASLDLARLAKDGGGGIRFYKYFLTMSGQCFPLKNANFIVDFLTKNYPKPFIDMDEMSDTGWVKKSFTTYHCFKKLYMIFNNFIAKRKKTKKLFKVLLHGPLRIISTLVTKIKGRPYVQLQKMNMKAYGGSNWWILPDVMMDYCLQASQNKKFNKVLFHVVSPDETYFQTILMNSPFADQIEKDKHGKHQNTMTFADFHDEVTGEPYGHPRILREKDFQMLSSFDNFLFARKFDASVDSKILDMLCEANIN